MKKVLSLLIVTMMILALVPFSAVGAVSDTDVCKIGNQGYETLDAAVAAVSDNQTIVLLGDATLSALNQNAINYTIDGQNKAYTVTIASGTVNIGNANVTFKDLKMDMGTAAQTILQSDTNKTGDVTFDGCQVRTYLNSFYKLNGYGNFTLIDSTWDKMTGNATVFYFRGDHAKVTDDQCVITVENSVITNHEGNASQLQNNCIFHLNSSSGSTFKFFLKGNTILENASETANAKVGTIFYNEQPKATMIINADPTVQLIMSTTSTALTDANFIYAKYSATGTPMTILNGTPKFIATPNVVAAGIYMPNIVHKDGNVRYTNTWSADGGNTSFKISSDYITAKAYKATVSSNVTFTPVDTGLTAATGAFAVKKFDGVTEYYATLAEAQYRTWALRDEFVFLNDYEFTATANFFSGFFGKINTYTVTGVEKADGTKVKITIPLTYLGARVTTFKNLEIMTKSTSFDTDTAVAGGSLVVENCIFTVNNDIRIVDAKTLTFKNSTVIATHAGPMFYLRNNQSGTAILNIDNSHLIRTGGGTGNNACFFHYNSSFGHTVNVTGNSILENRGTGASATHLAYNEKTAGVATLNMSDDTVLYLNPNNTVSSGSYFIGTTSGKTMNVSGNPTYKVNDVVAANGYSIYKSGSDIAQTTAGTLVGYSGTYTESGEAIVVSATVAAGQIEKGFSVKAVYMNADDFAMVDGASLRTIYKENGIRFSTTISAALKNALGAYAVYGTVIAPTNANPNAFEGDKLNIVATKFAEGDGVYTMHAAVIMPADADAKTAYELELAANAYFTVTYADGNTATFNAAFNADENVRSMKTVAENLAEQGYSNRVVDRILEVCA